MFHGKEMEWFKKCDGVVKVLDLYGWQAFSFGVRDLVWNSQKQSGIKGHLKNCCKKFLPCRCHFSKGTKWKLRIFNPLTPKRD